MADKTGKPPGGGASADADNDNDTDIDTPEEVADAAVENDVELVAQKAADIWEDLYPIAGYIVVYNALRFLNLDIGWASSDTALYWATGTLVALTLWVIRGRRRDGETIPPILLISAGLITFFGILGVLFQEKTFLYIKPTIQNLLLSGLILGGLAVGWNPGRVMFGHIFTLPDFAWRTLAFRWGLFFIAMAVWNEYLWRSFAPGFEEPLRILGVTFAPAGSYEALGMTFGDQDAESVWANWRLGNMAITLVWSGLNIPYAMKWVKEMENMPETEKPSNQAKAAGGPA